MYRQSVPVDRAHPALISALLMMLAVLVGGSCIVSRADAQPATQVHTYTVGVLDDNPPFSYRDTDGRLKGYAVDLLAAIEPDLNARLERRVGSTAEINSAFERGELDMLQSYVPNEERRAFAIFSMPYLRMAGTIFVRRDETSVARIEDLRGRKVLVHGNSIGARVLRDEGLDSAIVTVSSVEEGFRQLSEGSGDATLASRITGETLIRRLNLHNVVAVGEPVPGYLVNYCFAVRRGLDDLSARVEERLALLDRPDASGISPKQRIYDQWFGFLDPRFSATQIALTVCGGLGLALVIVVWAMLHQRRLRREIARQAAELQVSEERYRTVFESTLHGLIVFERDPRSPLRWLIVQFNPAASRILGEPATVRTQPTFSEAFPSEETFGYRLTTALAATDPAPFEHDRSRPGAAAWVDVAVSRLDEFRRLVAIRDITENKVATERLRQSETQLRQNQKLEAIGTLASGVAHDFNNVLTAILGNTELLRLDLPANHAAMISVQEIVQAAERARFLVRQILTFSRRTESRREVLRVTRVVKETLRFVSATAPSTIEFQHHVGPRSPEVEIDPTELHQVLMNLCTNAVHAMRDHPGVIEVTEDVIAIEPGPSPHPADLRPGEYLVLSVRDTGAGMPPEVQQRIFEPFFTTKPSGEGTGLGLAVVHGIVTGCGGTITVDSRTGSGTTFRIYLPAAQRVTEPPTAAEIKAPTGLGERILVVDDEPAIAQAAGKLLARLGYTASTFTHPLEALAEFRRCGGAFDVVITDLTMPRMSGIELANKLRAINADVPVILVSGFISDREMALARLERIKRIVEKPLSLTILAEAVASCLPQRRPSQSER